MPNQPQSNTPALVYVVIGSLHKGGAETHLARVMPGLDRKAFQVKLIELFGRGSLRQTVEKAGLEVYSSPFAIAPTGAPFYVRALRPFKLGRVVLYLASCFWLLTLLLVRRPKILHFFLPTAYVVGAIAGLLVGHKRMLMSRRSRNYYQQSGPIQSWLERRLHPFMARILGNSEAVIADLRQEGVSEKQLGLV